jgi:hypothetical protein
MKVRDGFFGLACHLSDQPKDVFKRSDFDNEIPTPTPGNFPGVAVYTNELRYLSPRLQLEYQDGWHGYPRSNCRHSQRRSQLLLPRYRRRRDSYDFDQRRQSK